MRRRDLAAIACGAVAWPFVARAQASVPVIGYVGSASADAWASRLEAFRAGLHEAGFDEGRNVAIEFRWADSKLDKLPELVDDLVRRKVSVLVTPGSAPAAVAAKQATTTIPIVFETGADPIEAGLVTSLNHPGGNVTGVAALTFETGPKRLAILHEALPPAKLIAVLVNQRAGVVVGRQVKDLEATAPQLGLQLLVLDAGDDRTLASAFETMRQKQVGGLVIVADPFANSRIEQIADLALSHAIPSIFVNPQYTALGGLMSYGGNIIETHRLAGIYVARILKGEKPGDLPVMQGTRVELNINLKTAKALGLTLPLSLLGRADVVIE